MLLREAIENYIRYARVEEGLSPTTLLNYQNRLRYFHKWLCANGYDTPDIGNLNTNILRRYLYCLSEQKQRPRTIKGKFACLDALCRFLIYTEVMETNPTDKIKLPKLDAARRLLVTDEEIAALFEAYDKRRNPRMVALARAVLTVFAHAGVRRAEARDLCVEDFNVQDRSLLIRDGKNSKSRRVFLSHDACNALKEYVALRGACDHPYLFGTAGRRMHDEAIAHLIEDLKRLAGLANNEAIKPHSIRHNVATRLLKNGANLMDISCALGHSGSNALRTTQIYLSTDEEQARAISVLTTLRCSDKVESAEVVQDAVIPAKPPRAAWRRKLHARE